MDLLTQEIYDMIRPLLRVFREHKCNNHCATCVFDCKISRDEQWENVRICDALMAWSNVTE